MYRKWLSLSFRLRPRMKILMNEIILNQLLKKNKTKLKKHNLAFTFRTVLSSNCSERLRKRGKGSVATSPHGGSPQSSGSAAGKVICVVKHPWKPPVCTGFRSSPSEKRTWVEQRGAAWGNHYKGQMFVQLW